MSSVVERDLTGEDFTSNEQNLRTELSEKRSVGYVNWQQIATGCTIEYA